MRPPRPTYYNRLRESESTERRIDLPKQESLEERDPDGLGD